MDNLRKCGPVIDRIKGLLLDRAAQKNHSSYLEMKGRIRSMFHERKSTVTLGMLTDLANTVDCDIQISVTPRNYDVK